MLTKSSKTRNAVAILMLAVAGFQSPVAADGMVECATKVLDFCAETLEDCNWLERIAVGAACTAALVGCSLEAVNIDVSL